MKEVLTIKRLVKPWLAVKNGQLERTPTDLMKKYETLKVKLSKQLQGADPVTMIRDQRK